MKKSIMRGTLALKPSVVTILDSIKKAGFDGIQLGILQPPLGELSVRSSNAQVEQLRKACNATAQGFRDVVAELSRAIATSERWIEGTFWRRARVDGNDVGYGSICAAGPHATTLHWIDNTGPITPGEMVLLDMGVEGHNLYTADVTRTLPIDGTFTSLQRDLYDLVYAAQQAGIDAVRPGAAFTDPHNAAMVVLAHGLESMSLLPVSAEEALDPESKVYARWTLHGVSHMLGMDVHDCGQASPEAYNKGTLAEGNNAIKPPRPKPSNRPQGHESDKVLGRKPPK